MDKFFICFSDRCSFCLAFHENVCRRYDLYHAGNSLTACECCSLLTPKEPLPVEAIWFQYVSFSFSVNLNLSESLVSVGEGKLLHHCIVKFKASLLLVSTFTQHMASSTKHNLTATTCITIKTLEKSFERKKKTKTTKVNQH